MVKNTVSDPQASSQPQPAASSSAPPVDTSDVIDWDLVIETPPRRRSGTICASLVHTGRSRPLPVNEAGISMRVANGSVSKGIGDIERIGEIHAQKLSNAGVGTVEQLLARKRESGKAGRVRHWQYGQAGESPNLAISDLSRFASRFHSRHAAI